MGHCLFICSNGFLEWNSYKPMKVINTDNHNFIDYVKLQKDTKPMRLHEAIHLCNKRSKVVITK